jgi:hypothetical protein
MDPIAYRLKLVQPDAVKARAVLNAAAGEERRVARERATRSRAWHGAWIDPVHDALIAQAGEPRPGASP